MMSTAIHPKRSSRTRWAIVQLIVQRPMSHCDKNLTAAKPRAHVRELQGAPRAAAGLVPGLVPGHDIATDIMTTM